MDFRVIEDVGGERPLVATDDAGGGGGDNRSGTGDGGAGQRPFRAAALSTRSAVAW